MNDVGRQDEENIMDNFGMVMSFTELRNAVRRAHFPWVVLGSGGKKGDEFNFGHVKFLMPLSHSSGDVK